MKISVDAEYLEELEEKAKRHDFFEGYIKGIEVAFAFAEELVKNIGNRKTENSSEKPNNYCDDCLYTDTCDSKEFFYACTSKATISKMEQVETMSCQECKHFHENAVMYLDQCDFCFKDCKYEPKDEPQTDCAWR